MGELNFHFIEHESDTRVVVNFVNSFGFKCLIKENTPSNNCIDKIIMNFEPYNYKTNVIDTVLYR